jgi:hypothetical protein
MLTPLPTGELGASFHRGASSECPTVSRGLSSLHQWWAGLPFQGEGPWFRPILGTGELTATKGLDVARGPTASSA